MANPSQFSVDHTYPGRWTIAFSNPPIDTFILTNIHKLGALT